VSSITRYGGFPLVRLSGWEVFSITGSAGSDHIETGAGNDTLRGDAGADSLNGGAGAMAATG